jgi:hypothetical protein
MKYYLLGIDKEHIDSVYVYTTNSTQHKRVDYANWTHIRYINEVDTEIPLQTLKDVIDNIDKLNTTVYKFKIVSEPELVVMMI